MPIDDGMVEGGQGQPRILVAAQTPPDDPARVAIHHDGEIAPRPADLQIRDVAHSGLIRARGHAIELAVGEACEERMQPRDWPI